MSCECMTHVNSATLDHPCSGHCDQTSEYAEDAAAALATGDVVAQFDDMPETDPKAFETFAGTMPLGHFVPLFFDHMGRRGRAAVLTAQLDGRDYNIYAEPK